MDTSGRPCPNVDGFECPVRLPGMECGEVTWHTRPGSTEAKAAYCRSEARRAGIKTNGPEDVPVVYRK